MTTSLSALHHVTRSLPALPDQAGRLLSQVAGYVGVRAIAIGLRQGLIATIAEYPGGITAEALAEVIGLDTAFIRVWCQSACAADVLDLDARGTYRLAPQMVALLLDSNSPNYIGGLFALFTQPEVFDRFNERLPTGERLWWDQTSPDWIRAVSSANRAFYNRLIPAGLDRVPGLTERLTAGARVLEMACGAGVALIKLRRAYPAATLVGLDGDAYSLGVASENLRRAGLSGAVQLVHSRLEDLDQTTAFDLVLVTNALHEARDIDGVTAHVHHALRPGGYFVISGFPFPETPAGLRAVSGRIMSGIQFFAPQFDGQLLPTRAYLDLLQRHGFRDLDAFDMTTMHAVVHGRK